MTCIEYAIELASSAGDDATLAAALGLGGWVLAEQGNHGDALTMMRRCQDLASTLADPWARTEALLLVTAILMSTGNLEQGNVLSRQLLADKRELGDELRVAVMLNRIGYGAMIRGGYEEARSSLEESLAIARRLRSTSLVTLMLGNLGLIAVFEGRHRDALSLLGEDLEICRLRGNRRFGREAILGLAAAHAALGNMELAVKLDAIARAMGLSIGSDYPAVLLVRLEQHLRNAREQADPAIVERLGQQGRTLTMDTAIAELERHAEASAPARTTIASTERC